MQSSTYQLKHLAITPIILYTATGLSSQPTLQLYIANRCLANRMPCHVMTVGIVTSDQHTLVRAFIR